MSQRISYRIVNEWHAASGVARVFVTRQLGDEQPTHLTRAGSSVRPAVFASEDEARDAVARAVRADAAACTRLGLAFVERWAVADGHASIEVA